MSLLTEPSRDYGESFLAAIEEYRTVQGERLGDLGVCADFDQTANFDQYLQVLNERARPIDPQQPAVFVRWLVQDSEYIGETQIAPLPDEATNRIFGLSAGANISCLIRPSRRHQGYATKMVGLALIEAAHLGCRRAYMISGNDYTSRVAVANHGVEIQDRPNHFVFEFPL